MVGELLECVLDAGLGGLSVLALHRRDLQVTVRLFGIEFADEQERDDALKELQHALDRITEAERGGMK